MEKDMRNARTSDTVESCPFAAGNNKNMTKKRGKTIDVLVKLGDNYIYFGTCDKRC